MQTAAFFLLKYSDFAQNIRCFTVIVAPTVPLHPETITNIQKSKKCDGRPGLTIKRLNLFFFFRVPTLFVQLMDVFLISVNNTSSGNSESLNYVLTTLHHVYSLTSV